MADTFTTKLGLRKPDPLSLYDVTYVNANTQAIDDAIGVVICTSVTRPATPWAGLQIYETDTKFSYVYASGAWTQISSNKTPIASAGARPSTGLYNGYPIWRTDKRWDETYDGTAWRTNHYQVVTALADITHPITGQVAQLTSDEVDYRWNGTAWVPRYPTCNLRQFSFQSIPHNSFTSLTWDAEDWDTGNAHNVVTNTDRYTATIRGTYEFSGGVAFAANATSVRACQWVKNGSVIFGSDAGMPTWGAGAATRFAARTVQVQMNGTTDWVALQVFQDSGGSLNTVGGNAAPTASMTVKRVA